MGGILAKDVRWGLRMASHSASHLVWAGVPMAAAISKVSGSCRYSRAQNTKTPGLICALSCNCSPQPNPEKSKAAVDASHQVSAPPTAATVVGVPTLRSYRGQARDDKAGADNDAHGQRVHAEPVRVARVEQGRDRDKDEQEHGAIDDRGHVAQALCNVGGRARRRQGLGVRGGCGARAAALS